MVRTADRQPQHRGRRARRPRRRRGRATGTTPRRGPDGRARRPPRRHRRRRRRRPRSRSSLASPVARARAGWAPTWPARTASCPTTRTWTSCTGSSTRTEARHGIALDVVSGGNSANLDWALTTTATSAGSTSCGSARRSCSAPSRCSAPDRRPAHRRLHPGRRGHRGRRQAGAPVGTRRAQAAFGAAAGAGAPVRSARRSSPSVARTSTLDGLIPPAGITVLGAEQRPPGPRRRRPPGRGRRRDRASGSATARCVRAMTSPFVSVLPTGRTALAL